MAYIWVKTAVGAVLAANFSFPLIAVLSNRHLWDEPMAVVAGNMSLNCTLFGLCVMMIGIYDVAGLSSMGLCMSLQYGGCAVGIAFKAAQSCAAFDQFAAVVYPLRHFSIITRARPWLFVLIWGTCAANVLFGLSDYLFGMESFVEYVRSRGGNSTYSGCRWETGLANVYTIYAELQMVAFSFITAGMLLYTGIVGHRTYTRLIAEDRQRRQLGVNVAGAGSEHKTFFDNYRAFKSIVTVLSLTVTLDIIAPLVRISSRWQPRPTLNGFLHQLRLVGFIFEGWAYGLLNVKLRATYRKMLCGRPARVDDGDTTRSGVLHSHTKDGAPHATSAQGTRTVPPIEVQSVGSTRTVPPIGIEVQSAGSTEFRRF